jgi:uncharacterized protein YkwD
MALCALTACATSNGPAQVSSSGVASTPIVVGDFANDLNAFRASQGRGNVQQDPSLMRAAQHHANDMAARNYFSHQSPGGPNGDNLTDRMISGGCRPRAGAENIAEGQTTEGSVFVAWQGSPGHRRNMLGDRYTAYGLGRSGNTWVLVLSSGC